MALQQWIKYWALRAIRGGSLMKSHKFEDFLTPFPCYTKMPVLLRPSYIFSSILFPFLLSLPLPSSWARPYGGTHALWHHTLRDLFIQVIDVVITLSLNCFRESYNPLDYLTRKRIFENKIFWINIAHLWRKT